MKLAPVRSAPTMRENVRTARVKFASLSVAPEKSHDLSTLRVSVVSVPCPGRASSGLKLA